MFTCVQDAIKAHHISGHPLAVHTILYADAFVHQLLYRLCSSNTTGFLSQARPLGRVRHSNSRTTTLYGGTLSEPHIHQQAVICGLLGGPSWLASKLGDCLTCGDSLNACASRKHEQYSATKEGKRPTGPAPNRCCHRSAVHTGFHQWHACNNWSQARGHAAAVPTVACQPQQQFCRSERTLTGCSLSQELISLLVQLCIGLLSSVKNNCTVAAAHQQAEAQLPMTL